MPIDIANPGSNKADLQAALGAQTGMVLVASGTITTPKLGIMLALPAGYGGFKFTAMGLTSLNDADATRSVSFGMQVSFDGETFINDDDAYLTQGLAITADSLDNYGGWNTDLSFDLGGNFNPLSQGNTAVQFGDHADVSFFPGDGVRACTFQSMVTSRRSGSTSNGFDIASGTMNQSSTSDSVALFLNRVTNICVSFYYDTWGDSHLQSGYYQLLGLL